MRYSVIKQAFFVSGSGRILVPERGLEPPLPCENQVLNLARLPVPPFGHKWFIAKQFHCARRLLLCQRVAENSSMRRKNGLRGAASLGVPPSVFLIGTSGNLN
jgi:hypothetical protein